MSLTCKVIRIGVFFDGTGNNLYNDKAGRSANGVSNIGKLFRLYPAKETFLFFKYSKMSKCRQLLSELNSVF